MKNKKGFTLVEVLAVVAILGLLLSLVATNVIKSMNESKAKLRYKAAADIVNIAEAYIESENISLSDKCLNVKSLFDKGYLKPDATNPATGKNDLNGENSNNAYVCFDTINDNIEKYKPIINDAGEYIYKISDRKYYKWK